MDAPLYQRAVTPSADAGRGRPTPVRGKMLSYNRKTSASTSVRGDSPTGSFSSGRAGAPINGTMNGTKKTSTYVLAPPASLDMNIQGRTASGIVASSSAKTGRQGGTEQGNGQSQNYFLSNSKGNSDLEPLSDEIPADGVVFARSRTVPNHLVVFRTQEEKARNPERLNLDRRQLDVCPLLKNEQRLRLLNYQNNNIRVMFNMENLPNLIFLDLYNNKLNTLDGPLSTLRGLRVLMIGKNRISEITNLSHLRKLDVLDLHSNDIGEITGLENLTDLRVLNLAGNRIGTVQNLSSLASLTELNLRRNSIERIFDLDAIPSLQRIFLSHNMLKYMSDIKCIFNLKGLIELSLDGNPLSSGGNQASYRHAVIMEIPGLKHLDLQKVGDEERRPRVVPDMATTPGTEAGAGSALQAQVNGQQQQLFHLSKFLGAVGAAGLPPTCPGSLAASRVGTAQGGRRERGDCGSDADTAVATAPSAPGSRRNSSGSSVGPPEPASVDQNSLGTIGLLKMNSSGLAPAPPGPQSNGASKNTPTKAAQQVFPMNTLEVFDIPGTNGKSLQATGDQWEWNHTRRTLSVIASATLDNIKCSVLVSKFVNQVDLMPGLKKLSLRDNSISSLNEIVTLGNLFRTVEHLTLTKQPIEDITPALLQGAIITSFPLLKTFNQLPISAEEREQSLCTFGPILRADVVSSSLAPVMAFEAPEPTLCTDGATSDGGDAVSAGEEGGGHSIIISSPKNSSPVNTTPAVTQGSSKAANKEGGLMLPRKSQTTAGYNVASLGGNMSCIFGSNASATATKRHGEILQSALRTRRLDRSAFDEVFDSAMASVICDSIEDMRAQWSRFSA